MHPLPSPSPNLPPHHHRRLHTFRAALQCLKRPAALLALRFSPPYIRPSPPRPLSTQAPAYIHSSTVLPEAPCSTPGSVRQSWSGSIAMGGPSPGAVGPGPRGLGMAATAAWLGQGVGGGGGSLVAESPSPVLHAKSAFERAVSLTLPSPRGSSLGAAEPEPPISNSNGLGLNGGLNGGRGGGGGGGGAGGAPLMIGRAHSGGGFFMPPAPPRGAAQPPSRPRRATMALGCGTGASTGAGGGGGTMSRSGSGTALVVLGGGGAGGAAAAAAAAGGRTAPSGRSTLVAWGEADSPSPSPRGAHAWAQLPPGSSSPRAVDAGAAVDATSATAVSGGWTASAVGGGYPVGGALARALYVGVTAGAGVAAEAAAVTAQGRSR